MLLTYLYRSVTQHVNGESAEVIAGYERNKDGKYEPLDKADVRAGKRREERRVEEKRRGYIYT